MNEKTGKSSFQQKSTLHLKKKTLHALAYAATFKEKNCNECIISNHNEEILKELSTFQQWKQIYVKVDACLCRNIYAERTPSTLLPDLVFWERKKTNILVINAYVACSANIYSLLHYNTDELGNQFWIRKFLFIFKSGTR